MAKTQKESKAAKVGGKDLEPPKSVESSQSKSLIVASEKKRSDFFPILRVLFDRMCYALFRRLQRYSSVFDISIDSSDLSCVSLDSFMKDLEHNTLLFKINSSICDQPAIIVFDNEFVDFILNFVLATNQFEGGRPMLDVKSGHAPLTILSVNLFNRVMEDFVASMQGAFSDAIDVDLVFKRIFIPFPINREEHFVLNLKFAHGFARIIMPLTLIEPICYAFEANFGLPGDFEETYVDHHTHSSPSTNSNVHSDSDTAVASFNSGSISEDIKGVGDEGDEGDEQKFLDDTEAEIKIELGPKQISIMDLQSLREGNLVMFSLDKNVNVTTKDLSICVGKIGYTGNSLAVKVDRITTNKRKSGSPV